MTTSPEPFKVHIYRDLRGMARFNNRCHQALLALALPITLLSAGPRVQALQADSIDLAANTNPEAVAADTASSDQESTEVLEIGRAHV